MTLTIATWNVNSVKSRLPQVLDWLRSDAPSVVLLQELKCTDDSFPFIEIEELGYNLAVHGEKTYNGVAILSKFPLDDIRRGLPGDDEDTHARYVEAVVNLPGKAVRVASVYVPNGQTPDSDKFAYKLRFLDRLYAHLTGLLAYEELLIIGGDYNIAPDDSDVHNPTLWRDSVLTHDEVRRRWRRIVNQGFYNAYKLIHPNDPAYSWWDYRANSFAADNGLLIDHLLLSPQAADHLRDSMILKAMRGVEKASDHTPVLASFAV